MSIPIPSEPTTRAAAEVWLEALHHPRPERWLSAMIEAGRVHASGDPALVKPDEVFRELLRDECDKLYNQAWCSLEQILEAEDQDSVMMIAMDDFPSAVEQAFSLAPDLAEEHLALFRKYRQERYDTFHREFGIGTARERRERIDCLAFWEENAEEISDLRRTLFRTVREVLEDL